MKKRSHNILKIVVLFAIFFETNVWAKQEIWNNWFNPQNTKVLFFDRNWMDADEFYEDDLAQSENFENRPLDSISYQLVRVTSDSLSGVTDIRVEVSSEGQILGLKRFSNNQERGFYPLENLAKGVVLLEKKGYKIVSLACDKCNFEESGSGSIVMTYLANGIFNSYGKFNFDITATSEGWKASQSVKSKTRLFSKLFIKGRWLFGALIGIEGIYPEE